MVYARRIGDEKLTFKVSGVLWRDSMVMQDLETGSWWSQVKGVAIDGPMKGTQLEVLPSSMATWADWKAAHPYTRLLKKSEERSSSRYQKYFDDPQRTGITRGAILTDKLPPKELIWGITDRPHAVAFTDASFEGKRLQMTRLGTAAVVAYRAEGGGVHAFRAMNEGSELRFRDSAGKVVDASGSSWDLERGLATSGPKQGARLETLHTTRAFWFAWSSFFPNTALIEE